MSDQQPVISVDAKKREMTGNFDNQGVEWHPKGEATSVNAYDFLTQASGEALPYGVFDIKENIGWVNVGITKDTTGKGLKVACEIDDKQYETGIEITDKQWTELNVYPNEFHGEWNYKILPN